MRGATVALLALAAATAATTVDTSSNKWVWGGKSRTINDNHRAESLRDRELVEVFPTSRPLFRPAPDYQPDRPNYRPPERTSVSQVGPQVFPQRDFRPNNNGGSTRQYPNRFDQSRPTGTSADQFPRPPGRFDQFPRPGGDFEPRPPGDFNRPDRFPRPGPGDFGQGGFNQGGFGQGGFNQAGFGQGGLNQGGYGQGGYGQGGYGQGGFGQGGFGQGPINNPDGFLGPEPFPRPGPGGPGPGPGGPGPGPAGGGSPPVLTGPVPSWEQGRGEGPFHGFDKCKCAHAFNCISPGIQFGHCDEGKMYCCHNSIHEGGKAEQGPGLDGPRPGFEGPGPGIRPIYEGGFNRQHGDRQLGTRPILVGPGGPTGIVSEGRPRPRPIFDGPGPGSIDGPIGNRPVLVGPGGPTGIVSEGRPRPDFVQNRPGFGRPGLGPLAQVGFRQLDDQDGDLRNGGNGVYPVESYQPAGFLGRSAKSTKKT